jgi:hypothetical protein
MHADTQRQIELDDDLSGAGLRRGIRNALLLALPFWALLAAFLWRGLR